jgi:Flp pilus assembly pilin Flp
MLDIMKRFVADESGAAAAEYAILVALVAGAVVVAVGIFGTGLNALFTGVNDYLASLVPAITE